MKERRRWGKATGMGLALSVMVVASPGIALAEKGEDHYLLWKKYLSGTGVTQDNAEAARWFRKAADQGHRDAQVQLGLMYERGQGVPQDDAEGVRWLRGVGPIVLSPPTALGSFIWYICRAEPRTFQAMNFNFRLLPPLDTPILAK